jgi:hypothetical protein
MSASAPLTPQDTYRTAVERRQANQARDDLAAMYEDGDFVHMGMTQ